MGAGQSAKPKVGIIIQARMKSKRLPAKIMMPLPFPSGKPLLWWIIQAAKKSKLVNDIILASSTKPENDPLISFCTENSVELFRGSEEDVLSRFIAVSREHKFDVVVRLTGDNPFVDTALLDKTIAHHIGSNNDYTYTSGLPIGMNFEVFSTHALYSAEKHLLSDDDKEHVTSFFRNRTNFKKNELRIFENEGLTNLRLTIDYPSDLAVVSMIMSLLNPSEVPTIDSVRKIRSTSEWIFDINGSNFQKQQYTKVEDELKAAFSLLEAMHLKNAALILKPYAANKTKKA